MIRLLADRPDGHLKVYDEAGALVFTFEAGWDAWGNYASGNRLAGYGFESWAPPGHFSITQIERFAPIPSEGMGQLFVDDMTWSTATRLVAARKAVQRTQLEFEIGGIVGKIGEMNRYQRSDIMLHGGGSNLGEPACYGDRQTLLRTFGCGRLHNADWKTLADWVEPKMAGNAIVYTITGDPRELPN